MYVSVCVLCVWYKCVRVCCIVCSHGLDARSPLGQNHLHGSGGSLGCRAERVPEKRGPGSQGNNQEKNTGSKR